MAPGIGYLLPTRERIMAGKPETGDLLRLSEQAETLGLDSIWIGDSLTARPRHEPLSLLAAVAARTRRVQLGTAVLLPALRNPVLLAHQVATLDQISEGRLILGVGIAADAPSIRAEFTAAGVLFEKRVGRMLEGLRLCRSLWGGEKVSWNGRWTLEEVRIGPTPHRPGGPPLWLAGSTPGALERVGKYFQGWLPIDTDPAAWHTKWAEIGEHASAAGRDPATLAGAMYLTVALADDTASAEQQLMAYLESYYGPRAASVRRRQASYVGPAAGLAAYLAAYAQAGASHLIIRFAGGDHARQLEILARIRSDTN